MPIGIHQFYDLFLTVLTNIFGLVSVFRETDLKIHT